MSRRHGRHVSASVLGVALCGLVISLWACAPANRSVPTPAAAIRWNGAVLDPPVSLPPLTLTRSDGRTFTSAETSGRVSLFFFGYTHCTDVCPLTLAQLASMHQTLGSAADRVDMYFATLDPARDTPERMQSYVANFPGVVGLMGSDSELADAQAAFDVIAERRDVGGGDYMLDHTAAIYLVNRERQIQLAYPNGTDASDIVADLRQAVGPL